MAKVTVQTLVSSEASVANVEVDLPGFHGGFVGASKKHPKDVAVHSVGEALALARAFRDAADDLEAYAVERNTIHQVARDFISAPFGE